MIGRLFGRSAESRVLGAQRWRGPTPWVIAIMSFSIIIVAAAGLALANTAGVVAKAAERRYSVQVPGGGRDLPRLIALVKSTPGVLAVEAVPESEMRKTLEQWLGASAARSDLPVPALINFDVKPGVTPATVAERLKSAGQNLAVTAHRELLRPLLRSLQALQWLALGLVLLLSGATAAAVILAARGAFDTHRSTIEVMHGIGATDAQVTRLFQRRIALDAFIGSVIGAGAAAMVLAVLLAGASFAGDLTGNRGLGLSDVVLLALLPLALTAIATLAGRLAVLGALRQSL
jgi:cell division transport system permease protein